MEPDPRDYGLLTRTRRLFGGGRSLPTNAKTAGAIRCGMTSSLPSDLQQLLDAVDDADRRGAAIAARVSDEEFHWKPLEGRGWSIAECLDHLATINAIYLRAIRNGVGSARANGSRRRGPAQPGFVGKKFVAMLEPPVKRKLRSPEGTQPKPMRPRDEILRDYHAAHDDVRRLIAECADIDANRATFVNPFIRWIRFSIATGLHVIPAHDRRHLWQAEQVEKLLHTGAPSTKHRARST